jgi:hypothetical protein
LAWDATANISAATTAAAGDDQRHVTRADNETASASATAAADTIATGATHGDLQSFASDQGEVTTDFGPLTTYTDPGANVAASALRAKGEDLISVGSWHREVDEASGIGEVERRSAGGCRH